MWNMGSTGLAIDHLEAEREGRRVADFLSCQMDTLQ